MDFFGCPSVVLDKFGTCDLTDDQYSTLQLGAFENKTGINIVNFMMIHFCFASTSSILLSFPVLKNKFLYFLLSFFIVALPQVIITTSPPSVLPYITAVQIALFLCFGKLRNPFAPPQYSSFAKPDFPSTVRAMLMVPTCVAILAVDFFAFPREYAKTTILPGESPLNPTYSLFADTGFSLMDMGVGSLVVVMGFVSRHARGSSGADSIVSNMKSVIPLVMIGFVRIFALQISGAYVPLSEYGRHWNFFFSLAVVTVFGSICAKLKIPAQWCWAAGLLLLPFPQLAFNLYDEKTQQLNTFQQLFFDNRFGICNCLAESMLYVFGVSYGYDFLGRRNDKYDRLIKDIDPSLKEEERKTAIEAIKKQVYGKHWVHYFLKWQVIGWSCLFLSWYLQNIGLLNGPSRQAGSPAWVLMAIWTSCFASSMVGVSLQLKETGELKFLVKGLMDNQLVIFLISNALTALFGRGMRSLVQSRFVATMTLIFYTFIVFGIAFYLGYKNKTVKIL